MPRALFLFLTNLALAAVATAQNLVPNPSFEDYDVCPDYFGQWWHAVGWADASYQTSDYFNECAGGVVCGVPFNYPGDQLPSHGDGYMGLITYSYNDYDYREIITAELSEPLVVGVPVYVSFKASCGGYGSIFWSSANWKARGPGLKFFVDLPGDWSTYLYPNTAAVYMDTVLADTSATWVTVSGSYVPDSAYRYVAIGNFFEDSLSWPSIQDSVYGTLGSSYAFVDEVCVSTTGSCLVSGNGVVEAVSTLLLQADATEISCQGCTGALGLMVFDASGRCVWVPRFENAEKWTVQVPTWLAGGAYVVSLTTEISQQVARFVKPIVS